MNRYGFLLSIALVLTAVSPARSAVLETWFELSVRFDELSGVEASDTAIGVTTISGTGVLLQTLSIGVVPGLSLDTVLPITDPLVSNGGLVEVALSSVRLRPDLMGIGGAGDHVGNIVGALHSSGNLTPATIPATGGLRLCLLFTGCTGPFLPGAVGGTSAGAQIGTGIGGILTIGGIGTIMISILAAPYTIKSATIFRRASPTGPVQTAMEHGYASGPLHMKSSTAQTSGVLQIISPSQITAVGDGNPLPYRAGRFTRLLVHFVPEPGTALLFSSGAIAIALLGYARNRR